MADTDIAVVGMACRLPGAPDLEAFWRLLREGRDARRELTDEHLRSLGVPPEVLADPAYVKAAMILDGIDQFDAGFFGLSARDAALFDPQHRVWLEVCWEALEHAGHLPERFPGRIGVFAGCGMDTYLLHNILTNPDLVRQVGMFLIRHTGNDKDFLATRTSYQFDLRGPSVNVLTACSTSLVAIHQAGQSLLAGECDMALAGGVTILVPQDRGYLHKEGEVLSPDGHCRAFDEASKGTIFGSGAGVVLLRRLQDAIADGDRIHAIVAGSAVNNDGTRKVSFLAPSVDGYAEVVAEALALAGVPAEQVQYLEAHGTGTSVGDPIEIEALTQAFRATTSRNGFCGIGSVKTNIGHLDTAAGVAGFLKVVLAMQRGEIPASRNYRRPNPLIDFPRTPFHVVSELRPWPRPAGGERIAGVSSLGVGGTNAHVLVREAAAQPAAPARYPRRCHLLPVSGKAEGAAVGNAQALASWLHANADADLADVAWTQQTGRRAFAQRGFAVGADANALAAQLTAPEWKAQLKKAPDRAPSVVFLFAGGGAQHPGMARGLYEHEPAFRVAADECFAAMPPATRDTLRGLLFGEQTGPRHGPAMECPSLLLPALFLVEYALARTFASFGIVPAAMLGHSVGEYVAATLGGTWSLDQVLPALVLRGECLEQAPPGAVLSVSLPAAEVLALGDPELSLSAANAPELSAVAGSPAAIERLERTLQARGVQFQRLRIGVGAHSHLLEPVLDRFRQGLRRFRLQPATTPWVSNVTGEFLDPQRAADPEYWVEHVRRTVRFQDGVAALLAGGDRVFVEIGPGKALTSLVRLHERAAKSATLVSMPHPQDDQPADAVALGAVGRLWQLGVAVDWQAFHGGVARRRVPLPTYAFQRQRHWIEPGALLAQEGVVQARDEAPTRLPESEWLRVPVFRRQELAAGVAAPGKANWLVVGNDGVAVMLVRLVREQGGQAVVVQAGPVEQRTDSGFGLPVHDVAAWERALQQLVATGRAPTRLLFALPLERDDASELVQALLAMWQALGRCELTRDLRVLGVTRSACRVASESVQRPGQGAVAGFLRVVPREFPGVRTRCVDLDDATSANDAARALLREAEADDQPLQVAIRAGARFVQELVAAEPATPHENGAHPWRQGAAWLISGGLGGIGLAVARHLATTTAAKLVLLGRRGLPPRELWDEWLAVRAGDRQAGLIRSVRELERAGAQVEVVAGDVADCAAMARIVQGATARFGKLHGMVHAAGVLDDGPLMTRQAAQCERMLAPKVGGAVALDAATATAPPAVFVVFASTSGLHAIPGQCDYAAANTALDAFAAWRSTARPGRTLALDWGVWQDAGMLATRATTAVPAPAWLGHRADRDGAVEFTGTWSPGTHWQLAEHRIRGGDCVMPGTGLIEAMAAAAQAAAGTEQVALQRIEFLTPLAFPGEQPRTVVVTLRASGDGHEVVVASSIPGQTAAHERTTHARAFAGTHADDGPGFDVASLRAALRTPAPVRGDQDRLVAFGPRWQCITAVVTGDGQVLADLRLPAAFTSDLDQHRAHAALLDMAFGSGIRLLGGGSDALFVPAGCEEVVVHGRVPAAAISHVRVRSHDEHARLAVLDVTVATPSGIVVLELRGLQLLGVRGQFGGAAVARPAVASPLRAAATTAVAAVPRIRAILPRGITAAEGLRGLEQALQTNSHQVVVSAMDPARVAAWLSLPPERPRASTSVTAAEPAAATTVGDAPRDDVEQKLAAGYRELLGTAPGLDQDFFELGGHSLLAVRLFARIHKEFGLDLELATLLGAGTVRKLAAVVRAELKLPEPGSEPVRSVAAKRGQHVVPIQTAGNRPPLFLVHGAGGNVLGFRDLAHYFGKDQPVYGLQARGVDGKQPPHATILEMATAYLAELREVQPHGPYCLGGYSGGGVVAFEMAQLLAQVGEAVPFVGMIDTWCPQIPERGKFARTLLHLGRLARRGPTYPFRILKVKWERRVAARVNEQARERGGVMPQDLRGFEVQFAFERAFESHQVAPYDGAVSLFRAEQQNQSTRYVFNEDLGWAPFVRGGLRVAHCPGNHYTMCTEPNVQVLCASMMAAMDEALAATR